MDRDREMDSGDGRFSTKGRQLCLFSFKLSAFGKEVFLSKERMCFSEASSYLVYIPIDMGSKILFDGVAAHGSISTPYKYTGLQ